MALTPPDAGVICLGPAGLETARTLVRALPGAELHGLAGRVEGAAVGVR